MEQIKQKTDYQLIAEAFGVSVSAVKQAVARRTTYPNNPLYLAYIKLQESKKEVVLQSAAN